MPPYRISSFCVSNTYCPSVWCGGVSFEHVMEFKNLAFSISCCSCFMNFLLRSTVFISGGFFLGFRVKAV